MRKLVSILVICAIVLFTVVSTPKPAIADGIPWWVYALTVVAGLGSGWARGNYYLSMHK